MRTSGCALNTGLLAALVLAAVAAPLARSSSQTTDGPKFEVASVRLNTSVAEGPVAIRGTTGEIGRYTSGSSTRVLIQQAYQVPFIRQIGGPDWIREDTYLVNARIPDDVERTPENTQVMIRNLLADRFKLVAHEEQREMPIYNLALTRADQRLGPKLQTSNCPPPQSGQPAAVPKNIAGVAWDIGPKCRQISSNRTMVLLGGYPISRLIDLLQNTLGRPIHDSTGLSGDYVLELTFAPLQAAPSGVDADGASIFVAIQEQLGLKLESTRGPVKVLVIDSIQRPSEN